ncbi:PASTA domain-containing protein [Conexibacter sp. W3-3-2]|uniref:PASTA domain-containing protein n=1 Tax=Conexibacter sp. W3-3-2 TaxID=2675227 RepID=UPI0012B95B31|nr:PASTA domain-containing protein [Conexibacter sp. W3-3-2]MTD44537.1 PASTA domain-containing protein [Conexibacter sp. W3-3-2]
MTSGVRCGSCGKDNAPGRDFCEFCGEYLSWAPTGYLPAVGAVATDTAGEDAVATTETPGVPAAAPDAPAADAGAGEDTLVADAPPATEGAVEADPLAAAPTQDEPPPAPDAPGAPDDPAVPAAAIPAPDEAAAAATLPVEAVAPPPATAPPVVTGDASLVLEAQTELGAAGVPACDAGLPVSFDLRIRNESRIVDNYAIQVVSFPEGWVNVAPAEVFLVPVGSGNDSEQTIRIDITPPRSPEATAGIWTFEILAFSRATGQVAARAVAQLEIRPFTAWTTEVAPELATGRLKAQYRVAVRNEGNAPIDLWLVATDEAGRVRTSFDADRVQLLAGEIRLVKLTARPRIPLPVGPRLTHRLGIEALPAPPEEPQDEEGRLAQARSSLLEAAKTGSVDASDKGVAVKAPRSPLRRPKTPKLKLDLGTLARLRAEDSPAALAGRVVVYRQRPLVPLWLVGLLALIAVAAYVVYTRLPDEVTVPRVVGARDTFTADKQLRAAGLVLAQPVQQRVDQDAPPGSIIGQSPEPGAEIERGSSVTLQVAAGTPQVRTPRLAGLTRTRADERLRAAGLTLGVAEPPRSPLTWIVDRQIPRADLPVSRGTPVMVFLKAPKTKKKASSSSGGEKKTTTSRKTVVVPAIAGKGVDDYASALEEAGLEVRRVSVTASVPAGALISVTPEPGSSTKEGSTVRLEVSDGSPTIAVETDGLVTFLDPIGGKELGRLPAGEGTAVEPSWAPSGKNVLYRDGQRLVLGPSGSGGESRTVYSGSDSLRDAVVAPRGSSVAMLRVEEEDGDLCFGSLAGRRLTPRCLPDDGWNLTGRPAWRPDGRVLVVGAVRQSDTRVISVRAYQTDEPFSTDPDDWSGRTAGDITVPGKGVRSVAFSPDGERIAAITNVESSAFEVVLADAGDLELVDPQPLDVRACEVAWRPDGGELAIVQADSGCTQERGTVLRFAPGSPRETARVADDARAPTYRPK